MTGAPAIQSALIDGLNYFFSDGVGFTLDAPLRGLWFDASVHAGQLKLLAAEPPRSSAWRGLELKHLAANPTCIACGGRRFLQVHHKHPFHLRPELELDPKNLRTLCMAPARVCHLRVGHALDWKAWNPHVDEDAALELLRIAARKYG